MRHRVRAADAATQEKTAGGLPVTLVRQRPETGLSRESFQYRTCSGERGRHGERRGSSTAKADEDVGSSVGRTIATGGDDKRRDPRASNDKIDLTGATRDESLPRHRRGVTDPQSLEARHDLSCAALAHTEELLDRRAVEVRGCHGTQGAEDFVKSMKAGGLGGPVGSSCSTIR